MRLGYVLEGLRWLAPMNTQAAGDLLPNQRRLLRADEAKRTEGPRANQIREDLINLGNSLNPRLPQSWDKLGESPWYERWAEQFSSTSRATPKPKRNKRQAATIVPAKTKPNWSSQSIEEQVNAVLADALARHANIPQAEAARQWQQVKADLAAMADLPKSEWTSAWADMSSHEHRAVGLAIALEKKLLANPSHTQTQAQAWAEELRQQNPPSPVYAIEAYLFSLAMRLQDWVRWDKHDIKSMRAAEVMQAVFRHHGKSLPAGWRSDAQLHRIGQDPVLHPLLTEAALLHSRLHDGSLFANAWDGEHLEPTRAITSYKVTLGHERDLQTRLDQLFAPPTAIAERKKALYFDGLTFRNAVGKNFTDLLERAEATRVPGWTNLSRQEKQNMLLERLAQLGESSQYAIATPEHSAASTVLRILRQQKKVLPTQFESPRQVLGRLLQLDNEWLTSRNYPIRPWLLFCQHLARSNGVKIVSTHWNRDFFLKEIIPRMLETSIATQYRGQPSPQIWLMGQLAKHNSNGKPWYLQGDAVAHAALSSVLEQLRDLSPAGSSSLATTDNEPQVPEGIRKLAAALGEVGLNQEMLEGNDPYAIAQALSTYGHERVIIEFAQPPRFDRTETARHILRDQGLSDSQIDEVRSYTIEPSPPSTMGFVQTGSRLEEFFIRAKAHPAARQMDIGSRFINPRQTLSSAEQAFNEALPQTPWIRAKAKENLRGRQAPLTQAGINAEVNRITTNYATPDEGDRPFTWETAANLLPVIGSVHMIEDGIRDHSWKEALIGTLFLGADSLVVFDGLTSLGRSVVTGIEGMSELPMAERATLRTVARTSHDLQLPLDEMVSHPDAITLDHDPYGIERTIDGEIPEAHRSAAARVRAGETAETEQGNPIVHLHDANRVVPVKSAGGHYHELDWQTEKRIGNAPLIYQDSATGRYYNRLVGLRGGTRLSAQELEETVRERITVSETLPLLRGAEDLSMRNFPSMFEARFSFALTHGDSTFGAKTFYQKCYRESPTFRRLFNQAADAMEVRNEKWDIVIGGNIKKPGSSFPLRRISIPSDANNLKLPPYVSAEGMKLNEPEQIYLHEMLHTLTRLDDPARLAAERNRGTVVYLEGKILAEMGYDFPPQLSYRRLFGKRLPLPITSQTAMNDAIRLTQAENLYLDRLVDSGLPVTSSTKVLGTLVSQRRTVVDAEAILNDSLLSRNAEAIIEPNLTEELRKAFRYPMADQAGLSAPMRQRAERLTALFNKLNRESPLFAGLLYHYNIVTANAASRTWTIVLDKAAANLPTGQMVHCVNDLTRHINVIEDETHYLSEFGPRTVEFERKAVQLIVYVLTGAKDLPASLAYTDRSAVSYLTDLIFKEANIDLPKRLAFATVRASNTEAMKRLQSAWLTAQRAASTEDRYIARKASIKARCSEGGCL